MPELTVMKHNRMMMAILGINSYPFASPSLIWLRALSPVLVAISLITCVSLAALYVYQETCLSLILEAAVLVIGATAALLAYLNLKWKVDSVGEVNLKLQEIVDQGINRLNQISFAISLASITRHSYIFTHYMIKLGNSLYMIIFGYFAAIKERTVASIYWAAERKCRQFAKPMLAFVLFEKTAYAFALLFSIYCICVGNFDTSTYYLPLRLAPPFSIDSIIGWHLFWAIEFACGVAYLCGTVVVTMSFVCFCFYLEALCDHFESLMESIDAEFCQNSNSLDARKILIKAVDHHNKIYE